MGLLPISPAIPELLAKAGRWAVSSLPIRFLSSCCRVNNSLEFMGARELGITSKRTLSCSLSIASSDFYGDLDAGMGATAVLFGGILRLRLEDSNKLPFLLFVTVILLALGCRFSGLELSFDELGKFANCWEQFLLPPATLLGKLLPRISYRFRVACNQAVSKSMDATLSTPHRHPKNVERSVATTAALFGEFQIRRLLL